MKDSKYLEKFQKLASEGKVNYELTGDYLLVEKIPDEDFVTESGLIIATNFGGKQFNSIVADRPNWLRVLACGEGYYDTETDPDTGATIEKSIPLDVAPGDVILVSQVSVKYFSIFGELKGYEADRIGLTRAQDIQLKFKGKEGYEQAFRLLNSAPQAKVEPGQSN